MIRQGQPRLGVTQGVGAFPVALQRIHLAVGDGAASMLQRVGQEVKSCHRAVVPSCPLPSPLLPSPGGCSLGLGDSALADMQDLQRAIG